jgi:ankyrin repeat protein
MEALVRAFDAKAVRAALDEQPDLRDVRDARGRNWLHLCCGVPPGKRVAASVSTVRVLLAAPLDVNAPAFVEDDWQATPLWYAISRGRNLAAARELLAHGASPEHCLWSAAFSEDVAAVRLLVTHGARLDPVHEDATPLLFAVRWSRFKGARALLRLGADPNFQDSHGRTALHYVLKKDSGVEVVRLLLSCGARTDLADGDGVTARAVLAKKRDPRYRRLLEEFP